MAQFDKVIPPGQAGKIVLELDGKKVHGVFNKSASVMSNDPKHPQMTISIAGKIIPYVEVEPTTRVYLRGMYGEHVAKELTVKSNEKKKFEIKSVTSNIDDKITYKVVPGEDPNTYTIKVWKNPKLPSMTTWGTLYINTNSDYSEQKIVQVNVTTRGAIICQPTTVNFGAVNTAPGDDVQAEPVERSVTVFKVKGDFDIKDVTFSSGLYKAEVEPIEEGRKYKVHVNFYPGFEKRNYVDEMIINTNDPREPSVRVRLIARAL